MADQVPTEQIPQYSATQAPVASQLTQARVPLDGAGDALASTDASGRTPIVVLTVRSNRVVNSLVIAGGAVLVIGVGLALLRDDLTFGVIGGILGLALLVFSVYSSFFV